MTTHFHNQKHKVDIVTYEWKSIMGRHDVSSGFLGLASGGAFASEYTGSDLSLVGKVVIYLESEFIKTLTKSEIEALVAHEAGHIRNRDVESAKEKGQTGVTNDVWDELNADKYAISSGVKPSDLENVIKKALKMEISRVVTGDQREIFEELIRNRAITQRLKALQNYSRCAGDLVVIK